MRHKLSEINEEAKTGSCSICGPVVLHVRNPKAPKPKGRWRCPIQKLEQKRFKRSGLLIDQYKFALQNTKSCNICSKTIEANGKSLAVDHCHSSGKFRGILCTNCNLALGLFNDDVEIMKKAIKYLEKKPSK